MNSLSPTTLLGYLRLLFAAPLLGFVVFKLYTDPGFDAVKQGLAVTAVWGIINSVLGTIGGHFTADADAVTPSLKTNATGPDGRVVVIGLLACLALGLSACGTNSPFEGATTATKGDGKIPVQVVVSADASGNSGSSTVNYDGGAKIIFGLGVTPAEESALVTQAQTADAQVVTEHDKSLGRAARIVFGKRFSTDRRKALLRRLGVGAPDTDYPVMDGPFAW